MSRKIFITLTILLTATLYAFAQNGAGAFEFVENKGQWDSRIHFQTTFSSGALFLEQKGFRVLVHDTSDLEKLSHPGVNGAFQGGPAAPQARSSKASTTTSDTPVTLHSHAYVVTFEGGSDKAEIIPDKPLTAYNNYFIGNDSSKWASQVKIYRAVVYKNIYPHIDVRYYSENGYLKYDIIVHPGGDINQVTLFYEGVDKLSVNKNQQLVIKTSVGEEKELYPYSFEFDQQNGRRDVSCNYKIIGKNRVKFDVKKHSPNATLVIDPTKVFVSFTGSTADNWGFTATPGPDGSLFAGGTVHAEGYPTTPGAFQEHFIKGTGSVPRDIAISRFNPLGTAILYATYIGGTGNEYPHSLYSDAQGNLVVMGRTYSKDYPGTFEGSEGGADIAVTKLNATGTSLIGSMRIGGSGDDCVNVEDQQETHFDHPISVLRNYGDDSRSEVILDAAGNIYIAAQTQSGNFPKTSNSFQPSYAGGTQDGIILKINPDCNTLLWASYLGGTGDDGAFVLALNPFNNNIYLAGATSSTDFPGSRTNVLQPALAGNSGDIDGFITFISNDGTTQYQTTYLGTNAIDIIYGIQFDKFGYPYVMGTTRGKWNPQNVAYSIPNSGQFVAKLQADLSEIVYTTTFGTGIQKPNMSPVAFLVDRCENVYISGWGGSLYGGAPDSYDLAGVRGMPLTPDAFQSSTDNMDFYFMVLKKNAESLLFGTFLGQNGGTGEHVDGGTSRYDAQGAIYQAICANCGNGVGSSSYVQFPVSQDAAKPDNLASLGCNLAAVKIAFNFAGVAAGPKSYYNGVPDSTGCAPFTVILRDTIRNAQFYEWSFGDNTRDSTTTSYELTHTFMQVGYYTVRLIAVDSTSCNIRDTAYIHIRVGDNKAFLSFDYTKTGPCESLAYLFDNTSTAPAGIPFQNDSFLWDFGDGTSPVAAGTGAVSHSFAATGTYNIQLLLLDTAYCNAPQADTVQLRVSANVEARINTPSTGCAPYEAVFDNTSLGGKQFTWDFGDGTTSTEVSPVHLYTNPGTYTVTLTANDDETCNKTDNVTVTITVYPKPTAGFNTTPVPPVENTPTVFYNLSSNAVRYKWTFGDGDSTIRTTTDTVVHQYNQTGDFNACLIAFNEQGCSDTACRSVSAVVNPLLDVPNAFTPGRFGPNGRIQVAGFGIARMQWKIYNRWGQLVFEANNYKMSWDGTFNGKPQPMDVYAYTLEVEFVDGTRATKKGDITLIR